MERKPGFPPLFFSAFPPSCYILVCFLLSTIPIGSTSHFCPMGQKILPIPCQRTFFCFCTGWSAAAALRTEWDEIWCPSAVGSTPVHGSFQIPLIHYPQGLKSGHGVEAIPPTSFHPSYCAPAEWYGQSVRKWVFGEVELTEGTFPSCVCKCEELVWSPTHHMAL